MTATFGPNMLISRIKLPRSTMGEEIRKENVTPMGSPAPVNPINSGMEEQEQNGIRNLEGAVVLVHPPFRIENIKEVCHIAFVYYIVDGSAFCCNWASIYDPFNTKASMAGIKKLIGGCPGE